MAELAFNQTQLSDGRIVEIREAVGNDEMIVAGQLGDVFEPNGAGALIFTSCLIARTIVKVSDAQPPQMRTYQQVRDYLGTFKGKDWNKIKELYNKVNGDAVDIGSEVAGNDQTTPEQAAPEQE